MKDCCDPLPQCKGCRAAKWGDDFCSGCIVQEQQGPKGPFGHHGKHHHGGGHKFKRGKHGKYANKKAPKLKVALVGNANVGKSVIFNHMTGMDQTTGNWPGKTVDVAQGKVVAFGHIIDLVDLPGTYSLSSFTQEEIVTRDFIMDGSADVVINVVDATALERNLYLTIQILELGVPVVIALNQSDIAQKKGIKIDVKKLEKQLGVPVVETVAPTGKGLWHLMGKVFHAYYHKDHADHHMHYKYKEWAEGESHFSLKYDREVEKRIKGLERAIEKKIEDQPARFLATKLVEGDEPIARLVAAQDPKLLKKATKVRQELSDLLGEEPDTIMTSERYALANKVAVSVTKLKSGQRESLGDQLDKLTTHPVAGYLILGAVMVGIFFVIINIGGILNEYLEGALMWFEGPVQSLLGNTWYYRLIWEGAAVGFIIAISFILPYILPFYLLLSVLEDSGYLARIAVLMDPLMHRFGLHGKAFLPILLGYGCSVPAVLGTRILETRRERVIAAFLASLVPCSARTIVIMALIGAFLGWYWALGFYVFNIVMIIIVGRVANMILPGKAYGLIMEMPKYKVPYPKVVLKQSWIRLKDFLVVALPLIVIGSIVMTLMNMFGLTGPVNWFLSPLTTVVLGLPEESGVILIFGIFQKELTFAMLVKEFGEDLDTTLAAGQMIVFTLFVMFYIPCVSTIGAILKEFGVKTTVLMCLAMLGIATLLGAIANFLFTVV